ncbi:MAG: dockerin type I repeat-containing protein [Clostridia bacterium]|nr:dockerin type I repeat-containing protein [Clostridia bacterium]
MKKTFKKLPLMLIVSIALVVAVGVSVFAVNLIYDFSGDGKIDDGDVIVVMNSIIGNNSLSDEQKDLADFDGNNTLDVLDVIALKRYILEFQSIDDGWTVGVY